MKKLGVIDIGTNSIRLVLVKVDSHHNSSTIALQKEVVRLGEGEFAHNRIMPAAMERGLLVVKRFMDIARNYGANEIVAVATAAVREAQNQADFVERAKLECGAEIRVVSGLEEARLIYLGISSGADLNESKGLFIDIGGGTTEVILGDAKDYTYLDSLKLGAIRMAELFPAGNAGVISNNKYIKMLDYVKGAASHAVKKVNENEFDIAFGSSGTIMNLGEITAKRLGDNFASIRNYKMKLSDLKDTTALLCSLTTDERRNVPGINPERADIIIGGGAILEGILDAVGADSIRISDRALRDGVVIDHIFQELRVKEHLLSTSPRERSILQFCRACQYEEGHANKVCEIGVSIFRQAGKLGLHNYAESEEELFRYAALVHDVGTFIGITDHHKHSYYLTKNWGLLGFDFEEVEIIASSALCHRKLSPKKSASSKLSSASRKMVEVFSSIIRVADALDRSQLGLVREVILRKERSSNHIILEIYGIEDFPLEMWALEIKKRLFEQTFNTDLSIKRVVMS